MWVSEKVRRLQNSQASQHTCRSPVTFIAVLLRSVFEVRRASHRASRVLITGTNMLRVLSVVPRW